MNDITSFICRFHGASKSIEDVFTQDCSYWFAAILFGRFIRDGATIMYDKKSIRFGTRIRGRIYDITGDVTDKYTWIPWESVKDTHEREKIIQDEIMF